MELRLFSSSFFPAHIHINISISQHHYHIESPPSLIYTSVLLFFFQRVPLWGKITKVFTLLMSFNSKQKHFIGGIFRRWRHTYTWGRGHTHRLKSQHINTSINSAPYILISTEVKIPDHPLPSNHTHTLTAVMYGALCLSRPQPYYMRLMTF